jgi:hypothetical protein
MLLAQHAATVADDHYWCLPVRLDPRAFPTSDELNAGEYELPLQRIRLQVTGGILSPS